MIWGYHYFWKHPGGGFKYVFWMCFTPEIGEMEFNLTSIFLEIGLG